MSKVNYDYRKHSGDKMLSMPIPVHVAGWKSDTLTLQRNGWDFYVEYEMHMLCYNMAMVNRQGNGQAISFGNRVDDHSMEHMVSNGQVPPIIVEHMSPGLCLEVIFNGRAERYQGRRYMAVNMEPTSLSAYEEGLDATRSVQPQIAERLDIYQHKVPMELMLWRPDDRQLETKAPDMVIKEQDTDELLSLLKSRFEDSDAEYDEYKGAGLITDQKTIQRHLHLVSVR